MNKSQIFNLAHHKTRIQQLKAVTLNREFNYQVTFSFYLKDLTNAQPQKVTVYGYKPAQKPVKKKINKACAMVGEHVKPEYKVDGLKIHKFKNDSLTVTYNLDTLLHFIISAISVVTIFALSLQAINII